MNKDIALLRNSIAGITALITQRGLKVTQEGTEAYVQKHPRTHQPVRVNIPYLPDNATSELVMAIQGFIDHECGHVLDTDYSVWADVERWASQMKARGIPGAFSMWNIVEDTYIERAMAKRFAGSGHNLERLHDFFVTEITAESLKKAIASGNKGHIFNVLLVPMARAWAGQPVFVRFMADKWPLVADYVAKVGKLPERFPDIANSRESFELARALMQALYVKPERAEAPKAIEDEVVEPPKAPEPKKAPETKKEPEPKEESKAEPEPEPESEESEPAEDEGEPEGEPESDPDGDEDGEPAEGEEGEGEPGEPAAVDPDAETPEMDDDAPMGADDDEDVEADEDAGESAGLGEAGGGAPPPGEGDWDAEKDAAHTEVEITKGGGEVKGKVGSGEEDDTLGPTPVIDEGMSGYDEQLSTRIGTEVKEISRLADYLVFTKDHDKIETYEVSAAYDDKLLTKLNDETRSMVGVMQKDIERMMAARSQVIRIGGFRSGRLRGGALHRLRVNDDRVFERKTGAQSKDVVVSLLIDNSGSMSSGARIKTAITAGYALSQTLERVGITHEVLGFTTGGSGGIDWDDSERAMKTIGRRYSRLEPIRMPVFKGFHERLVPDVCKRFADGTRHSRMANNIDGESVEYAAMRLAQRKAERKVLIVLSDGQPAGAGTGNDLKTHLRKTVREVGKAGIECIGIGIQTDAVKQYYPKNVVLNNVADLPGQVMGELKRILTAA